MATVGRSLTRHFNLESRQHEILGLDLGEGIPRRALWMGLLVFPTWWVLAWWTLRIFTPSPLNANTLIVFLAPPSLLVLFGMRPSTRCPRRRQMTEWVLALRYPFSGHEPIIRLGARPAARQERLPWRTRWGSVAAWRQALAPETTAAPWAREEVSTHDPHRDRPNGPSLRLHQQTSVVAGPDLLARLTKKRTTIPKKVNR